MHQFWARLLRLNARLLLELARQFVAATPGPPEFGYPILFGSKGAWHVTSIDVTDIDDPRTAHAQFTDADGVPADMTGATVAWASDNEVAATVAADAEDQQKATVTIGSANADGTPAATVITCKATNADGSEVTLAGTVTVHSSEATGGEIVFDAPAEPPPAEPV